MNYLRHYLDCLGEQARRLDAAQGMACLLPAAQGLTVLAQCQGQVPYVSHQNQPDKVTLRVYLTVERQGDLFTLSCWYQLGQLPATVLNRARYRPALEQAADQLHYFVLKAREHMHLLCQALTGPYLLNPLKPVRFRLCTQQQPPVLTQHEHWLANER